jgi:hypothetical protein
MEAEEQVRNELVQNLLVLVGVISAAELSDSGRKWAGEFITILISYLLNPTDEKVIEKVAPIYG